MKILITGIKGQLGQSLLKNKPLSFYGENINLLGFSKKDFDLANPESCKLIIRKFKPQWIINCGAYTAVDKAESHEDIAYKINSEGPYFLARELQEVGGKLIHLSSDFVFDGQYNKPYKPNHPINPINIYGKTKAQGEEFLIKNRNIFNDFFIIRTSWVIGNFGDNFLLKMLRIFNDEKIIRVVNDQFGCTTNVNNLAKFCWDLIYLDKLKKDIPKILHFCDSGICSWFDVAIAINEFATEKKLLKKNSQIIPVSTDFYNPLAQRPSFSLLDCEETFEIIGYRTPHWRKSINALLDLLKTNL